jgi:hypothetical protein
MTDENKVLSLSKVRKARERAEKDTRAAHNRAWFGRSKADKELDAAHRALADKAHDAHKKD